MVYNRALDSGDEDNDDGIVGAGRRTGVIIV